jgi:ABC-type branched-subunit amino acid transport system ATPase component
VSAVVGGAGPPLLEARALTRVFGGLVAVSEVDLAVRAGAIHALIGPNGAGKTTIFNLLSGVLAPTSGEVRFGGTRIDGRPSHQICRLGLARTFQNLQIFGNMTVLEHVMVGRHVKTTTGFLGAMLRVPSARAEIDAVRRDAAAWLRFIGLADRADDPAGSLPYGHQRRLELARALATEPRLLLLDEPAAGLLRREKDELGLLVNRVRDGGVTVLLVEHDVDLVMAVADRVTVLNYGEKLFEGTPAEVQAHPEVIAAYLGEPAGA